MALSGRRRLSHSLGDLPILLIFPTGLAIIGLCYVGWAWASLHSGRLRTLPKTYVEKRRSPVTYWLLFLVYWVFGLGMVAFAAWLGGTFWHLV